MFAVTAAAASIVAAALVSMLFIIHDQRDNAADSIAAPVAPGGQVEAPGGLVVVRPVESASDFEDLTGFAPFVPDSLPPASDPTPKFAVAQADANGLRAGRVAFSSRPGWSAYGITGPVVVIEEAKGAPGAGVDGKLKTLGNGTRALAATLPCGDLVLDVQLYFGPDAAPGEELVTPYMRDVATQLVDGIRMQCAAHD
jgi:hypothetical protein